MAEIVPEYEIFKQSICNVKTGTENVYSACNMKEADWILETLHARRHSNFMTTNMYEKKKLLFTFHDVCWSAALQYASVDWQKKKKVFKLSCSDMIT